MPTAGVDLEELTRDAEGFSPADLRSLAREAALAAMAREPEAETAAVTHEDFREALGRFRSGDGEPVGLRQAAPTCARRAALTYDRPMSRRAGVLVLVTFAALLLAPAAFAHFAFVPGEVPARSFARLQISVPNEEPNASTVRVALQIPESVVFVRVPPTQGWTVDVEREPLDEPLLVGNRRVDDRISLVEWSGGEIAGTDSQSFAIRLAVPRGAGETLAFPATQTYSDDQVVEWVGAPGSDNPAPLLAVTAFDPAAESLPIRRAPQEAPPPAPATTETTTDAVTEPDEQDEQEETEAASASADDDDGVSAPLLIALALGLAAVLALAGWLLARRRRAS